MASLDLLSLSSADFTGGMGHRRFQPSEFLGAFGDRSERVHRGRELPVISLAGGGGTGSSIMAEVELPDGPRPGFARHELWLRGQWNHQEHLRGEDIKLGAIMPTFGHFLVQLDDAVVFDGPVLFWNYRQWRFWPRWSLRLPAEALQPGRRRLTIVNRTPPFDEGIPPDLAAICPTPEQIRTQVRPELRQDTVFHLHEAVLASRCVPHLGLWAIPSLLRVGAPTVLLVASRRAGRLRATCTTAQIEAPPEIQSGLNRLVLTAHQAGPMADLVLSDDQGDVLRHPLPVAIETPDPGLRFGHLVGGHLSARPEPTDYGDRVLDLLAWEQGNLVAFNTGCPGAPERLRAPRPAGLGLHDLGLSAVIRGDGATPDLPGLIAGLGPALRAVAPHEPSIGLMAGFPAGKARHHLMQELAQRTADTVTRWRRLLPAGVPITPTDPSFHQPLFLAAGADGPGIETFMVPNQLVAAAARGACRMQGLSGWTAINSWECQSPGGLDTWIPPAPDDAAFASRRRRTFRLSQYDLVLGGARTIYTESGFPEHVLARQYGPEHPDGQAFLADQREVWTFARLQALTEQPQAACAFLRRSGDAFLSNYGPRFNDPPAPSDAAYEQVRAIWPQIHWGKNRLAHLCPEVERSRLWSATPFGEADLITLPATPDRLNAYPLVITTGDLALDDTGLDLLESYAHGGGQVLLFAADVAAPSRLAAYRHTAVEADRWRRSWGAGSIHLVDLPEHRYEAEQAHRRLRAVQDLAAALPVVWRLEPNRHIHVQAYAAPWGRLLFLLNHDLEGEAPETVQGTAHGISFAVTVPPAEVRSLWILPEAVVIPGHAFMRLDAVSGTDEDGLHVQTLVPGDVRILTRDRELSFALPRSGRHRLKTLSPRPRSTMTEFDSITTTVTS